MNKHINWCACEGSKNYVEQSTSDCIISCMPYRLAILYITNSIDHMLIVDMAKDLQWAPHKDV